MAETRAAARIGCLSNTNAFQWAAHFGTFPLIGAFEFRFLSFELGLVKPDPAIFDGRGGPAARRAATGCCSSTTTWSTSRPPTAPASRSRHVRGVGEARRALVDAGVLAG